MAKKKHKPAASQPALSDKNYIASGRARKLPIYKCEINEGWEEGGLAQVIVYRQHVNHNLTVGFYLVDLFCAGVKDTFYYFNQTESFIQEVFSKAPFERKVISYDLAHNIIYGAIAYAEDLGIEPDLAFKLTEQILEEDTEDIPLIEISFGRDGKPVLVLNPDDPRNDYYLRQLQKNLAPGEYNVVGLLNDMDNYDDEDDDDDDFPDEPELWDAEDWDDYIVNTESEELDLDIPVVTYMYQKITPVPAEAAPVMEAVANAPAFTISDEDLPDLNYTPAPEEQTEVNSIEAALDKEMKQQDEDMLHHLREVFKKSNQLQDEPEDKKLLIQNRKAKPHQLTLAGKLQQNIKQWPHNPVFYDQLIRVYQFAGLKEEATATVKDFYQQFPDNLLAKIRYANYLIEQDQLDQVMPVFKGQYNLSTIYPAQNTFAMANVVSFYSLMAQYFLKKGNLFLSMYYIKLRNELDIPDDMPIDIATIFKINGQVVKLIKPIFEDAQQDEEKKRELIDLLIS